MYFETNIYVRIFIVAIGILIPIIVEFNEYKNELKKEKENHKNKNNSTLLKDYL